MNYQINMFLEDDPPTLVVQLCSSTNTGDDFIESTSYMPLSTMKAALERYEKKINEALQKETQT